MPTRTNSVSRMKSSESGFTFIELMISIVIFMIFIGAVYGLMRIANIQKTTIGSETEVMTNLRVSLNTIRNDAVNAGLRYKQSGNMPDNLTNLRMGLPADANTTQDILTAVISGNDINDNNVPPGTRKTDVVAFAYRDVNFNGGNPIAIASSGSLGGGGVVLTTTVADAAINANPSANPYDLYLISSDTRTSMGLATRRPTNNSLEFSTNAANDVLGINAPYSGAANVRSTLANCVDLPAGSTDCMNYGTGNLVSAIKVFWVSYHVTPDGTLTRTTYGNNTGGTAAQQIQTQPLAYNIQNFQIRYLLRDGTSSENPSNNGASQNVMNNVVQIEVTVSAKIQVKENGISTERLVDLKSTFSTKNLNYD